MKNNYFKKSKVANALFSLLIMGMLLNACGSSKYLVKKWISWDVVLDEKASALDKTKAESAVQKYIIGLYYERYSEIVLKNISFKITYPGKDRFRISVNILTNDSGQNAEPIKKGPGPVPPKQEVWQRISPFITNIQNSFNTNGNLQNGF